MPAIILLAACKVNSKSQGQHGTSGAEISKTNKSKTSGRRPCAVEACAFFGVLAVRIGLLRRK